MEYTQIRATKQLTSKLKKVIKVRGRNESMATLIEQLVDKEFSNYVFTKDGLAKVGDELELANEHRKLTGEICTIVSISDGTAILSCGYSIGTTGRIAFFSRIVE